MPYKQHYVRVKTYWSSAFKTALAKILSGKYWAWKLKKKLLLCAIKCVSSKQAPIIFKKFLQNTAKTGNQYLFACKQMSEWVKVKY